MELIVLRTLLIPVLRLMFVKLLTPVPPVHVQVVLNAIVVPERLIRFAHCDPEVAPDSPQRSV
jgi:hypothetical protein